MLPHHQSSSSSNIVIPQAPEGNITGDIMRMLKALVERLKSGMHRIAYGDQTDLGLENQYTYDPELQRWIRKGAPEESEVGAHLGDALKPPIEQPHVDHPHCVAPHINPLISPTPFRGVFKRPSDSTSDKPSSVDMSALSHPVYAPSGSVLEDPSREVPAKPKTPEPSVQIVRTSPFSK